jgi:hypothetical protein
VQAAWPFSVSQRPQDGLLFETKASDIAFSRDGKRVITVNLDRPFRWDLDIRDLIARAKDVVGRNFNESEW